MGRILSAFLMLGISSMCGAQIYKYLGIEDGLSNRRIYRIQKDGRGYMWFLTQEGMDRYDGKRIRHYTVLDGNLKVAPQVNLNWLYTDTENTLWVVGRKGRIFHYDTLHDRFRMVYRIPGLQDDFATGMLCYAYMDRGDRIWLCQGDHIIRYDTRTGIAQRLVSRLRGDITAISETDGTNLFIGTVNGLFPVRERDGVLEALADTDSIRTPVSELYYHPGSKKLFVGTFRKGILVYGVSAGSTLRNVAVNRITPLNDRELLIATGGRGVYRMDVDSLVPKPFMAENTVFLLLTELIRNFYKVIIQRLDVKRFGPNKTSRIKAFVFRFVSVPAKWIRTSRWYVLNIYTCNNAYADVFQTDFG